MVSSAGQVFWGIAPVFGCENGVFCHNNCYYRSLHGESFLKNPIFFSHLKSNLLSLFLHFVFSDVITADNLPLLNPFSSGKRPSQTDAGNESIRSIFGLFWIQWLYKYNLNYSSSPVTKTPTNPN